MVSCLIACGSTEASTPEPGPEPAPEAEPLPAECRSSRPPPGPLLVDDFEDGDHSLGPGNGLSGRWYAESDGSGTPVSTLLATPGSPESPRYALHLLGTGFETWGAFVAARLNASRSKPCIYDLSGQKGVSFLAKGQGRMRVNWGTVSTTPVVDGGDCVAEPCSDYGKLVELEQDWTVVQVGFDELVQPSWAAPASWDASQVLRVSFWAEEEHFELWLDDVRLF